MLLPQLLLWMEQSIVWIRLGLPNGGVSWQLKLDNYKYAISMEFKGDKADVVCTITEESGTWCRDSI